MNAYGIYALGAVIGLSVLCVIALLYLLGVSDAGRRAGKWGGR